jgi:uncharacterized protein YlxW (UPF0749 family)
MTWTPEQIINLAAIIFGFLGTVVLTVGGWFFVARLNQAQTAKAKAEAEKIYQEIAHQAAEHEAKLNERILTLEKQVGELKKTNEAKETENSELRRQLAELKVQYDEQALELSGLREEVQLLRTRRK